MGGGAQEKERKSRKILGKKLWVVGVFEGGGAVWDCKIVEKSSHDFGDKRDEIEKRKEEAVLSNICPEWKS